MSTTRLQEVLVCFGKQKQTDIATANTGSQMWRFGKLNAALANPKLNTENDAEEFGKGHEFPTQSFQTSWDVSGTLISTWARKSRPGRWPSAWARWSSPAPPRTSPTP